MCLVDAYLSLHVWQVPQENVSPDSMGSQIGATLGMSEGVCCCCRAALDEAASASYELTDAEYAANEADDTWVDHLVGILVAVLQWLQPLLTPSNYNALVASLLQKASQFPRKTSSQRIADRPCSLITELMQHAAEPFHSKSVTATWNRDQHR